MVSPSSFCTHCGERTDPHAKFCSECGATVQSESGAPIQPNLKRQAAQLLGWGWIGLNGLTAVYSVFVSSSLDKWLIEFLVLSMLAVPGFLLVLWGRRSKP